MVVKIRLDLRGWLGLTARAIRAPYAVIAGLGLARRRSILGEDAIDPLFSRLEREPTLAIKPHPLLEQRDRALEAQLTPLKLLDDLFEAA